MKREIRELGQAVGCSARQVQQWGYRGHVPYKWRLPMLREAASRLVPLSEDDFVWEKAAKRRSGRVSRAARSDKAARGRRANRAAPAGANQ